ncbi:aspartic proteinase nepenthesin-1-like [Silene latifolia]|uniref:aspartic proteinase nepenthesin-1-like n=1 Tax=Silene latifolia TaxID=37657 RepID=UPI003D772833
MSNVHKLVLFLYLLDIGIILFISSSNGFSMRMIPIDSHHLQIVRERTTMDERLQLFNNITMSRIYPQRKKLSPDSIKSRVVRVQKTLFVTQLHLGEGNTAYTPYVLLDTASDITWVQCEGCNPCFELNGKNFDFKRSTFFRRVNINDEICFPPKFYYDGSCGLNVNYGSQPPYTSITGLLGRETFYFKNSRTNNMDAYKGLPFGCVLQTKDLSFGPLVHIHENVVAGVFGLVATPRSLITNLDAQIHGRFYYCLPLLKQLTLMESTIYFGDDAQISGDATREVQTILMKSPHLHFLSLSGISVNGKRLSIDSSIFEYDEVDNTKGFYIDTGAPFTVLVRSAYNPLREAIVKFFRDTYGWLPRGPGLVMDLCYSIYPGYDENLFPIVVFHFLNNEQVGEVDLVLSKEHLFVDVKEIIGLDQGLCLMLLPTDDSDKSFLGAFQQANFGILYDTQNGRLSFIPKNCLENI